MSGSRWYGADRADVIQGGLGTMSFSRVFSRALACGLTAGLLLPGTALFAQKRTAPVRRVATDPDAALHVLNRLGYGPRPGDVERVVAMGVPSYVAEQLNPETIDDSDLDRRLNGIPSLNLAQADLLARYNPPKPPMPPPPPPAPAPDGKKPLMPEAVTSEMKPAADAAKPGDGAQKPPEAKPKPAPPAPMPNPGQVIGDLRRATVLRATYSRRQLYEATVNFWENHFSIFINKDSDRFLMTAFDRDAIRPYAFGRFRDLLGATAKSPAMLYYLDNWQSRVERVTPATKDKPEKKSGGINENYARELLELHTLGVDGGYSQKDVQEVARCLTGWTIRKPNEEGLFMFNPAWHDNGEKVVLGKRIPAGGGIADVERVLDILARHPSTAKFIATKLARRFVSDTPPPALVARAADTFLKTDGDIRETLKVIVTSPEFAASIGAKVKNPFEFAVSVLRATDAETDGGPVVDWISKLGQPIFGRLTPDGFPDRADEWLSAAQMLNRLNFGLAVAQNQVKGTKIDGKKLLAGTSPDDGPAVTERVISLILNGKASDETRRAVAGVARAEPVAPPPGALPLVPAVDKPKPPGGPAPAAQALALALGSPEFQKR
jgi:uncharacterized protein (DUF1800 family)